MRDKICKLLLYAIMFLAISCITEPEEPKPPKLTDLILGKWEKVFLGYLERDIEEVDSTIYLNIMPNNNFELYFKCKFKDRDSCSVIHQKGTYKISQVRYRKYDHSSTNLTSWIIDYGYLYEGYIWFYPAGEEAWGGNFTIKIKGKLRFSICSTLEADDGMKIFFSFWYNY